MKPLFIKYNRFRKPQFQTETIIFAENSNRFVRKRALSPDAIPFIQSIAAKERILQSLTINPNVKYSHCFEVGSDFVKQEFFEGTSIAKSLDTATLSHDLDTFLSIIDNYYSFLNNSFKTTDSITTTDNFLNLPAELLEKYSNHKSFADYTNLDISPSNVVVSQAETYQIFDYEWVLPLSLPIHYIFYRNLFFLYLTNEFENRFKDLITMEDLLSRYGITADNMADFEVIEEHFQKHIRGDIRNISYPLNYLKRRIDCNELKSLAEQETSELSKLYLDAGNGFTESLTVSQAVNVNKLYNSFDLEFALPETNNLQAIRWDPVERSFISLKLHSITITNRLEETTTISFDSLQTNAKFSTSGELCFYTRDPNITFPLPSDTQSISISGEWKMIDFQQVADNVLDNLTTTTLNLNKKNQELDQKNGTIENLNQELGQKNGTIENLNQELGQKNGTIENLNQELGQKNGTIENLNQELDRKNGTIDILNQELDQKNDTIENLNEELTERHTTIDNLNALVSQKENHLCVLSDLHKKAQRETEAYQKMAAEEQISRILHSFHSSPKSRLALNLFKPLELSGITTLGIQQTSEGKLHSYSERPKITLELAQPVTKLRIKLFVEVEGASDCMLYCHRQNPDKHSLLAYKLGSANSPINQYFQFPEAITKLTLVPVGKQGIFDISYLGILACNPLAFKTKYCIESLKFLKTSSNRQTFLHDIKKHSLTDALKSQRRVIQKQADDCTMSQLIDLSEILMRHKSSFDELNYLKANPDIAEAIKNGLCPDALTHFMLHGGSEIKAGSRRIHPSLPKISEKEYIRYFPDIKEALQTGKLDSAFEHFLTVGQHEMRTGIREIETLAKPGVTATKEIIDEIKGFSTQPLISIIMPVYNVDPTWLHLAIESIHRQWYTNWELCIADDASTSEATLDYLKKVKDHPKIKVKFMSDNGNISAASNAALTLTSGAYIALMDNDDELTPNALYEVVKAINQHGAEFIYSDEDKLEMDGTLCDPHYKPDYAPDMFLSQNYLSHLGVIKKSLITRVNGFTLGLEGAQDYDLYLKVLEHTDKIYHIQKILYHWRKIPGSTASTFTEKSYAQEAGRMALQQAMDRRGIKATVVNGQTGGTYKVCYDIEDNPLISIIIPFKDKPELLATCVQSILEKSTYQNFEIIAISNNSREAATFKALDKLKALDKRIQIHEYNVPFNYSDINNHAVREYAKGEQILFLNNDIEIITPSWLEELLMFSQSNDIGAVGAKLYFPDNTIQHAGLVLVPTTAHKINTMYPLNERDAYGYFSRLRCINNYSAVTAACLMVAKSKFDEIDGFDSEGLKIAYNDVDLCLRLIEKGYRNVFTPFCEAYHHESISRGYEDTLDKIQRNRQELHNLTIKHPNFFSKSDPYYNPNLRVDECNSTPKDLTLCFHFSEEIIIDEIYSDSQSKEFACIFSHYDGNDRIDDYVVYYLKQLAELFDIIFVSTAEGLTEDELSKIAPFVKRAVVKENYGYDFGAWKSGLDRLTNLDDYEKLLLCNDSIYGPFFDLNEFVDFMDKKQYDICSISDNYQIKYHLQSFFVLYNKSAFSHQIFKDFWANFIIYKDKPDIILANEVGFSDRLINQSGLSVGAYCSVVDSVFINIMHHYWKSLITENHCPFIKKELLRDNPENADLTGYEEVIAATGYPIDLITKNLSKIKQS